MGMGASNSVPTSIRHWLLHDRNVFFTTLVLTCIVDRVITLSPFTVRGLLRIAEALGIIILRFIPFKVHRQVRENQWPVIVCFLAVFVTLSAQATYIAWKEKLVHLFIFTIIDILVQSLAVLLISLKPTIVIHLINYPRCRKFFRLIKVFISLSLAGERAVLLGFQAVKDAGLWAEKGAHIYMDLPKSLVTVVLSVTGLQTQDGHVGFWIELSLLISLVVEWSSSFGSLTNTITCALIILIVGVGMVTGNLQITTSIARLVLSLLRICGRELRHAYPTTLHPSLLHTIHVFYWLVICQGSLYLAACVFGAFAKAPGPAATDQDTSATSTAQEISTILHPSDGTQDQTPPRCFIVGAISVPLP